MVRRIVVLGRSGQLARSLAKYLPRTQGTIVKFVGRDELDLLNEENVVEFCDSLSPDTDWLINATAYTAVDQAEEEQSQALRVNAEAVGQIASVCAEKNICLLHVSTDYVFEGSKAGGYSEVDPVGPGNVYGWTKRKGEELIHSAGVNAYVVRTSWLYSEFGHNFVRTMLRLFSEREVVRVVDDQIGCPTYCGDLVDCIAHMISVRPDGTQVYHFSNKGAVSWYGFAQKIAELASVNCEVIPVSSDVYPTKALRPRYSVLLTEKFFDDFAVPIPTWEQSLERCIQEMEL